MSSSNVAAKFDHIADRFEFLFGSVEPQVRRLNIGGFTTTVRSHDPVLLETFVSPFVHLLMKVDDDSLEAPSTIMIDIALRKDLVDPSNALWPWELDRYQNEHGIIQFYSNSDTLFAFEYSSNHVLLIFDALPESQWIRPEYSRPLIERIFSHYGATSVHGGTLGVDGRCVLITAKGGSGKSSLITAGITQGLDTIGDDFEFLGRSHKNSESLQLWSLYHSVKLGVDSPAWNYLGLAPTVNSLLSGMDKSLVNLLDSNPDRVVTSQQPVAIVVPTLGTAGELVSISVEETLTALLPTSVGMCTRKRESIEALKALVQSMPCYSLTLTRNLDIALEELTNLLASHASSTTR